MANIYFYDNRYFKTWNYNHLEDPKEIIINSLAILIGNYNIYRKQAAILLLKALIRDEFRKFIFEDNKIYPTSRNDSRVLKWSKKVTSIGKCEECGSTENLEAHHIVNWADYPQGRIDIKNGICLCLKCHTSTHRFNKSYYLMKGKLNGKINT